MLSKRIICDYFIISIFFVPNHFWPFNILQVSFLVHPLLFGFYFYLSFLYLFMLSGIVSILDQKGIIYVVIYVPVVWSFFSAVLLKVPSGLTLLHLWVNPSRYSYSESCPVFRCEDHILISWLRRLPPACSQRQSTSRTCSSCRPQLCRASRPLNIKISDVVPSAYVTLLNFN